MVVAMVTVMKVFDARIGNIGRVERSSYEMISHIPRPVVRSSYSCFHVQFQSNAAAVLYEVLRI